MSESLRAFEAAANALRDAARRLAADPPLDEGGEVDRLGTAVNAIHATLDVIRSLGEDADHLTDE